MESITPEAIVFDLGGVIVDIDVAKTQNLFRNFSGENGLNIEQIYEHPLLFDFEKGKLNPKEFIRKLSKVLDSSVPGKSLIEGWNSMIVDIPLDRLMIVSKIKESIPVYAFSNTNSLHIEYLNQLLLTKHGYRNLNHFFTRTFYSHEIGFRKPERESFEWIMKAGQMTGKNILFLDDNFVNIQAAEKAGFRGWHITSPQEWIDYFIEWKKK